MQNAASSKAVQWGDLLPLQIVLVLDSWQWGDNPLIRLFSSAVAVFP